MDDPAGVRNRDAGCGEGAMIEFAGFVCVFCAGFIAGWTVRDVDE